MTKFHEGQEVEVCKNNPAGNFPDWRKAKIVCLAGIECAPRKMLCYCVQFTDGINAIFDVKNIRAAIVRPSGAGNDSFPSDYECANGDCE